MKQPIIKAALIALLIGAACRAEAQDKVVRLDPAGTSVYKLTYLNQKDSNIKVEWMDNSGRLLFTDNVNHVMTFARNYNLQRLPDGKYLVKVTDGEGEYLGFLDNSPKCSINATIVPTEQCKAKVVVRGEKMAPVHVRVLDKEGSLVFHDEVQSVSGFSRQYDLSGLGGKKVIIEVSSGDSLLASAVIK